MTNTMLEFRDITFSRGPRLLLNRVSFSVEEQGMVALVGPNGVGKTTLLKLAARLLQPAAGHVRLMGKPLTLWGRRDLPRTIALVPQELEIPFNFQVQELVAQGRVPYVPFFGGYTDVDHRAVEHAMDAVDVLGLRHRHYAELSGGERQRVKIAIGLAQQPKLMLLDEPTQHLDVGRQIELVALLRELNERGITIVAAVHDLNLVAENFSRVVLLTPEPGWIEGAASEILRPELLERAFAVEQAALAPYCVAPPPRDVMQA